MTGSDGVLYLPADSITGQPPAQPVTGSDGVLYLPADSITGQPPAQPVTGSDGVLYMPPDSLTGQPPAQPVTGSDGVLYMPPDTITGQPPQQPVTGSDGTLYMPPDTITPDRPPDGGQGGSPTPPPQAPGGDGSGATGGAGKTDGGPGSSPTPPQGPEKDTRGSPADETGKNDQGGRSTSPDDTTLKAAQAAQGGTTPGPRTDDQGGEGGRSTEQTSQSGTSPTSGSSTSGPIAPPGTPRYVLPPDTGKAKSPPTDPAGNPHGIPPPTVPPPHTGPQTPPPPKQDHVSDFAGWFSGNFAGDPKGTDSAKQRLTSVLKATQHWLVPGLQTGGIAKDWHDDGFNQKFFKDPHPGSDNQVGHFLTAVNLGLNPGFVNRVQPALVVATNYAVQSIREFVSASPADSDTEVALKLIIGHEKVGDSKWPFDFIDQYQAATAADVEVFKRADAALGTGPKLDLQAALDVLKGDPAHPGIAVNEAQPGNSYQDLLLSLVGWRLGQDVGSGKITDRQAVADWIKLNLH